MNEQALTVQATPQSVGKGIAQGSVETQPVAVPTRLAASEKNMPRVSLGSPASLDQIVSSEHMPQKGSVDIFVLSLHGSTEGMHSPAKIDSSKESPEETKENQNSNAISEVLGRLEEVEPTVAVPVGADSVTTQDAAHDKADNEEEKSTGFIAMLNAEVTGVAMTDLLKEIEKKRYTKRNKSIEPTSTDTKQDSGVNVVVVKKFFLDSGRGINILDIMDELLGNKKKKKEKLSLWAMLKDLFAISNLSKKAEGEQRMAV